MDKNSAPFLKKLFCRETVSYVIFGVLTTVVSIATYFVFDSILNNSPIKTSVCTILSWIFAVAFAFVTNKLFVFNSKSMQLKVVAGECTAFVSARLFSLGFELIWMIITVDLCYGFFEGFAPLELTSSLLGTDSYTLYQFVAKCIANVFVMIMNYIFSKLFIFKKNKIKIETNKKGANTCEQ